MASRRLEVGASWGPNLDGRQLEIGPYKLGNKQGVGASGTSGSQFVEPKPSGKKGESIVW